MELHFLATQLLTGLFGLYDPLQLLCYGLPLGADGLDVTWDLIMDWLWVLALVALSTCFSPLFTVWCSCIRSGTTVSGLYASSEWTRGGTTPCTVTISSLSITPKSSAPSGNNATVSPSFTSSILFASRVTTVTGQLVAFNLSLMITRVLGTQTRLPCGNPGVQLCTLHYGINERLVPLRMKVICHGLRRATYCNLCKVLAFNTAQLHWVYLYFLFVCFLYSIVWHPTLFLPYTSY